MKALLILSVLTILYHLNHAGVILDCVYRDEYINDWKIQYSCIVKKFDVKKSIASDIINNVSGNHLKAMDSDNITQILGRNKNIEKFPSSLGKSFGKLKCIRFALCNMWLVQRDDFADMLNLEYLDLIGNKIEYLKSNTFELVSNLREVILNNNRIEFVGESLLKPLVKIEKISFGGNVCVTGHAHNSFEDLQRLNEEIALKCSDITMSQLITKLNNLETKLTELISLWTNSAETQNKQKIIENDLIKKLNSCDDDD